MGEFTIQCTMCDGSFGSEAEYNEHGCTDEDIKFPVKIKLEPQEDNDDEMERALLNLASSELDIDDTKHIKCEPMEIIETKEEIDDSNSPIGCDMVDPLSLQTEFDENVGVDTEHQVQDRILNETETFTERYTPEIGQEDIITGENFGRRSLASTLKNYTCNCKICSAVFYKKEEFTKHFREEHKTYRPYECGICGKKFLHKHYVNLHMRVHTGEKPYVCKLCPRSYSHKTSFTIHMRIHNGDRPYACGVCGKKCYDKSGLTSHMRSHTKETPYQCEVCGRRFTHSKSLLVHRRNHTGEKPYVCSYCGKAFRHWHKHKIHVRLHTGERPYKCKVCGKGFPRNDEVSRHMRSHQGIKSFKCSICGVYCATQASITGHINLHHSNLKTNEMEPPPEKTLVKNSTSGILGTKAPEPRSMYRITTKIAGIMSSPSTSKSTSDEEKKLMNTQPKPLSTRIIEVTSKDTPISIPSSAKKSLSKKINCILPKPKTSLDSNDNKTMNYQEFLKWQERMLTNQGLIVKGYSTTSSGNSTSDCKKESATSNSTNSSLKTIAAAPVKKEPSKTITKTNRTPQGTTTVLPSTPAPAVNKPQYLLLSQGGEGSVTKILLPISMVEPNSAPKTNVSTAIGLPASITTNPAPTGPQANRPFFLVPQNMPSQPLLLVSNGGQRMLLMPSHTGTRPVVQATPATKTDRIVVKEEPNDGDNSPPAVTIKTEKSTPPQSPETFDIPLARVKEEPNNDEQI